MSVHLVVAGEINTKQTSRSELRTSEQIRVGNTDLSIDTTTVALTISSVVQFTNS